VYELWDIAEKLWFAEGWLESEADNR